MRAVMNRLRRDWISTLLVAACVGGCYESDLPLDSQPGAAINGGLVGTWRCLPIGGSTGEQPATVVVKAEDKWQYGVTWQEGDKEPERYRAYSSSVRVPRLLNVEWLKEGKKEGAWAFMRYSLLHPDVLLLQVVDDGALKRVEKSRPALRRAVERQQKSPSFYVDFAACARANNR